MQGFLSMKDFLHGIAYQGGEDDTEARKARDVQSVSKVDGDAYHSFDKIMNYD